MIRDSKQLAYPKWKGFFDNLFIVGLLLLVTKLIIMALNRFAGTDITILKEIPYLSNFLPLVLMVVGGVGSDQLKKKYVE